MANPRSSEGKPPAGFGRALAPLMAEITRLHAAVLALRTQVNEGVKEGEARAGGEA